MVKKIMKIAGIAFIVLLVVGIGILAYLCYQNLHWWEMFRSDIILFLKMEVKHGKKYQKRKENLQWGDMLRSAMKHQKEFTYKN